MRMLGGSLLDGRVREHSIGIAIPLGMEPGPQILELHLLQFPLVEQASVSSVIVEDLAVPIFLSCPEIIPASPEAIVPEVDREEPVEVGKALFSKKVQRQGCPSRVWNT
jgi:hypothetical protein